MELPLGALGALASSATWAYASTRYAHASGAAGSVRINLFRVACVAPFYCAMAFVLPPHALLAGVSGGKVAWLLVAALCSYVVADSLFFAAAQRVGISTALAIASCYPLWAAAAGVILDGDRLLGWRAVGLVLCVGGVVTLIRLTSQTKTQTAGDGRTLGLLLAVVTSILWAGNSIGVKRGGVGLSVWQLNGVRFLIAVPLLGALTASRRRDAWRVPDGKWSTLIPPLIADGIIGSIFYAYGLGHTSLAVGATLSSLAPLFSVPVAVALGQERWNGARFGAVCSTVGGVVALVLGA